MALLLFVGGVIIVVGFIGWFQYERGRDWILASGVGGVIFACSLAHLALPESAPAVVSTLLAIMVINSTISTIVATVEKTIFSRITVWWYAWLRAFIVVWIGFLLGKLFQNL